MRYYFGALAIIVLLFFGVKLIFSATRKPAAPTANTAVVTQVQTKLADLAPTNAEVSVRSAGPLSPDEKHYEVEITISRDERTIDVYKGYDQKVVSTKSYDNNQEAYDVFLRALSAFNFTKSQKTLAADERDACPLGKKYTYEIRNTTDIKDEMRLWSVSCGVNIGTAGTASGPTIRSLFVQQIPDYNTLVANTGL